MEASSRLIVTSSDNDTFSKFWRRCHFSPDFESKLDDKIDSLEKLVTQLTTNRRSTSPSASVARLCAICPSSNHYTDACPSLQHPVASDAPQAYSTNIYNRQQKQQQQQMQFYDAPFQITPQPSTSEPTLKELLEQMTMQNLKFKQESMKIQQETQAAMQNLSNQIRQMATLAPEENAEVFEDQARISSTMEPGRPFLSSTVEVNVPQLECAVDELEIHEKISTEQKHVYSETDIDLIDNSEVFDSVLVSETIDINVVLNEHDYSDEISIDNSFELNVDFVDNAYVNIDFETGILQSHNMIELEQNFDLTQFSENCECDCESGSCPICIEIDYVLQTDSEFITDVIDYEFDDNVTKVNENTGITPVSQTQQLLVDRRLLILLIQQLARRRSKKSLDLNERAVLGELLLKTSSPDPEVEDISLMVQNWQLPP
ncbi:uncharacterized protein LOC128194237 [Vigna angularis]|uniref:uncharacterized protein LOC128194237 n=1 Tax=Phaseolus angularis TaxID=3914 RepID=UPI0022B5891A|nr:uncharacterized protein LOC128194237 [Vigna angularis]